MGGKRTAILISSLLLWATTIVSVDADGNSNAVQPGSVDDPVITKSYFDQHIQQSISDELSKQTITEEKVKQIIGSMLTPNQSAPTTPAQNTAAEIPDKGNNSQLTVIKLEPGQTLYGGAGTEMIVRTGKVVVTSSDENGIPDVTSGKDINAGTTVELNHLLVIPRDGRGIKSDPKLKQDIYVMLRGSYLQVNADGSKVTP